jgi:hypothetical protein
VLRFLGKSLPLSGRFPRHWEAELATHLGSRSEGTRIRHTLNGNSIKLYDKAFYPARQCLARRNHHEAARGRLDSLDAQKPA